MEITCLGGGNEIGKEGFLVKDSSSSILLEYGVKLQPEPPKFPEEFEDEIDAIFISHAHLDHIGALPLLYKKFKNVPNFLTPPTLDLAYMLIKDFLKVQDIKGFPLVFSEKEIEKVLENAKVVNYHTKIKIKDKEIFFFDAGHIPGSYSLFIKGDKRVLFTGDINNRDSLLIKGNENFPEVDILIIESTYSDKEHNDRKEEEINFVNKIEEYSYGLTLLPCFAISRTQEVLLILEKYGILDKREVFIDGMAKKASDIILYHKNFLREPEKLKNALKKVKFLAKNKQRDKALRKNSIIITTSGMLQGGPIVYYLKKLKDFEEGCILLTGFQVENTAGDKLLKTGFFECEDERFKVKMEVEKYDFSAHADRKGLFEIIKKTNPKKIICIHGEKTEEFANELQSEGYEAYALKDNESLKLC